MLFHPVTSKYSPQLSVPKHKHPPNRFLAVRHQIHACLNSYLKCSLNLMFWQELRKLEDYKL